MATSKLMAVLTSPSKIASKLDWKKTSGAILNLDFHKDRIGIAIATHPAFGKHVQTMEPIQLPTKCQGKNISEETIQKLANIVQQNKVCGVIVSWPLQRDTGRMGAACGRVLHALDNLLESKSSTNVITQNRPLCLWDGVHPEQHYQDEWGRCSSYSRTCDKQIHYASKEQYNQDDNYLMAAQVWDDFVRVHWPALYQKEAQSKESLVEKRNYSLLSKSSTKRASSSSLKPPPGLVVESGWIEENDWEARATA